MEAERLRRLHPDYAGRIGGILGEYSEAGFLVLVVDHRGAALHHFSKLEHHLLVGDDDEILGDGEIVHHGRSLEGDFDVRRLGSVRGESEVLEVGLVNDVVAERVELSGNGVHFRVRDHRGVGIQLVVEIVTAYGFEVT